MAADSAADSGTAGGHDDDDDGNDRESSDVETASVQSFRRPASWSRSRGRVEKRARFESPGREEVPR